MLTLRKISIALALGEIFFFHRNVLLTSVDFYKTRRLIQAGERTFACVGRPIELKWRYRYSDVDRTRWYKHSDISETPLLLANWTSTDGFILGPDAGVSPDKLNNSGCCALIINYVEKDDEALYSVVVETSDRDKRVKKGNTSLYVYGDCPDVSGSQLSITCDAVDSSTSKKTTDFTYRDIVDLSVSSSRSAVVRRRFFYQEQQHKIVQQPIRAKCYLYKDCDVVHWSLEKKTLSLAFFSKIPYLNMTTFVRLYHKKALLTELNTTFRIVDPESEVGKSLTNCKNRVPSSAISIRRNPFTRSVVPLASLAFAASNLIHQIVLLP